MDWTSGAAPTALVIARAIHFGATALLAGALLFRTVVAGGPAAALPVAKALVDRQTLGIAGSALAVSLASGFAWFALTAAEMGNLPLRDALQADVLQLILAGTQFGFVASVRLVPAIALAISLALDRTSRARWLTTPLALASVAGIAWTGHAGSGFGASGNIQLAADALHIVAASAWIGGLLPLALLLSAAHRGADGLPVSLPDSLQDSLPDSWADIAGRVTRRFSTLGIVSVATLIATGAVNAWFLVGSVTALIDTEYGRVLMLKLALFVAMLAIAAINRNVLTPRLAAPIADGRALALNMLIRHCIYESALGVAVISVAGWLGTLHPAAHFMN